jgi:putative component of membrane protein insertase Oxa1/YidC/SpoIIIJ protein YidD
VKFLLESYHKSCWTCSYSLKTLFDTSSVTAAVKCFIWRVIKCRPVLYRGYFTLLNEFTESSRMYIVFVNTVKAISFLECTEVYYRTEHWTW